MITLWLILGLFFTGYAFAKNFDDIKQEGDGYWIFFIVVIALLWPFWLGFEIREHFKK